MKENTFENGFGTPNAVAILNSHPDFKKKATEVAAILGYNKKFYALGLVDINKDQASSVLVDSARATKNHQNHLRVVFHLGSRVITCISLVIKRTN